jgi:uncharacterized protein
MPAGALAALLSVLLLLRDGSATSTKCSKCADQHGHARPPADSGTELHLRPGRRPPVPFLAEVPLRGVNVTGNDLLLPIMTANVDYLLTSFDIDHMLLPFRNRAGLPAPAGSRPQNSWDDGLRGSNAGRFLMGAGNTLRWLPDPALHAMLTRVIDGIDACENKSAGYSLAFEPAAMLHSEQGDYARSWFTQGLIEAGKSGNTKAFPLVRRLYDWFNSADKNTVQAYLYDGVSNGEQGHIASTRVYLETPGSKWDDAQVAQDVYRDDLWLSQLAARNTSAITWYHMPRPNHPHCYLITGFIAFFDQYRSTGNGTYLEAARGAMAMLQENYVHIDGTSALVEGSFREQNTPRVYRILPFSHTGETCCTAFWIKFLQRFHLLEPVRTFSLESSRLPCKS